MLLTDLPAAAMDVLLALAGPDAETPLASIEIRHAGGTRSPPRPPAIDAEQCLAGTG